ncbi:MAG: DUF2341 domain-containing protein [Sphingobacteriales bacterium]
MKIAIPASRACKRLLPIVADFFYVINKFVTGDIFLFSPSASGIFINFFKEKQAIRICGLMAITLFASILVTQNAHATVTGPGATWGFCRKITLTAATPAANFQVKVILTTGQYTNVNATGNDLRFYDINNNICNYWIETWNNAGTSTIWVNVVASGATALYMYYGNAAAPAASNGAAVFDFFDDFTSAFGTTWSTITTGGSVTQSGTVATLSNTNAGTVSLSNTNPFTTSSASFILETKHKEGAYNRNRFYAATSIFGSNPFGFDNGYFNQNGGAQTTAQVFWNGVFQTTTPAITAGTDYLSQWQITDGAGNTYNWNTYTYPAMALLKSNSNANTATPVRFISISVTEVAATSTIIDWVRVRKASASFTEVTGTAGAQVTSISAGITAQTNVLCSGKLTGSATVTATGGGTPYTYSWNSTPVQTTQTALGLPAGTYIATVTENTIGISATATAIITQPTAVIATVSSQSNINCFNANDGTIQVSGSGGSGPYTFSVDNGLNYLAPTGVNLRLFNGLLPNTPYKIRVKDNVGCESKSVQ